METKGIYTREDAKRNRDKKLVIGEDYQCIAEGAFQNNIKVRTLFLDRNVREIRKKAFLNCTAIKKIEMPGVQVIGQEAFEGCVNLTGASLPDTVETMGNSVFSGCKRLMSVQIGKMSQDRVIRRDTFRDCVSLKDIQLPQEIKVIEDFAFYKCQNLSEFFFSKCIREIGNSAFYGCGFTELELTDGLERIGDSAFLKCRNLEYVRIPESVKTIEKWAFHGCNRLKVIEITHEPENIGDWIINRSVTVRCYKGGKVDKYCKKFQFKTEYLSEK